MQPIKPLSWVDDKSRETLKVEKLSDDAKRLYYHAYGLGWIPSYETESFLEWYDAVKGTDPEETFAVWRKTAYDALFALEEWITTGELPDYVSSDTTQISLTKALRCGLYAAERLLGNR